MAEKLVVITMDNKIRLPRVPNFLRTPENKCFDVAELADEELEKIGKAWTIALQAHAAKRRKDKKNAKA